MRILANIDERNLFGRTLTELERTQLPFASMQRSEEHTSELHPPLPSSGLMGDFPTQAAATAAATGVCKVLATAGKIVTLKIKLANGRIREERTYPRSSDPVRSPG